MPVFLSDTQANTLERAQTDLAKLLGELRDLHSHFRAEADADSDRDAQVLSYVDEAFADVHRAHTSLRIIREFLGATDHGKQ